MKPAFFTVGHSTRSIPDFVELLRAGQVQLVVDVRKMRGSRTNPQYNEDVLRESLAEYQIGYEAVPPLGGLRKRIRDVPPEVNGWWENRSFHNYADYTLSDDFGAGLERLIALGRERPLAMMCSEAVWWRCHRRLIADQLLARGEEVFHLMDGPKVEPARLSDGARVSGDVLTYPSR